MRGEIFARKALAHDVIVCVRPFPRRSAGRGQLELQGFVSAHTAGLPQHALVHELADVHRIPASHPADRHGEVDTLSLSDTASLFGREVAPQPAPAGSAPPLRPARGTNRIEVCLEVVARATDSFAFS